jgi:hypothetical protein
MIASPRTVALSGLLLALLVIPGAALAAPAGAAPPAAPHGSLGLGPAHEAIGARHAASYVAGSPHPEWSGTNFFNDVNVTFTVPGLLPNPDYNFTVTPTINLLPQWTNGFWMNISTDVAITYAYVTIWGYTLFPAPGQNPNIPNYNPNAPRQVLLWLNPATGNKTGSFYFNDYETFWPGSVVYFNLTVASISSSPSIIFSTEAAYYPYNGTNAKYTWQYEVAAPWSSTVFSNDIRVSSTPAVFGTPAYDPNPFQPFVLTLTSYNQSGGPANPIPMAQATVCVTTPATPTAEALVNCFPQDFGPTNSTVVSLPPLGPYPGDNVSFALESWLPWQGTNHAIDFLLSNVTYNFSWSKNGQWWHQGDGLGANAILSSYPNVLGSTRVTLPSATPVNVTILSPTPNVTISSAELDFRYRDSAGSASGALPFKPLSTNYSYVLIPGLPAGGELTFYVQAKDVYGNPVSSGNFTYNESGPMNLLGSSSGGSFFFEGLDVTGAGLIPRLNFTISNATWSENGVGTALGFGAPFTPGVQPYPTYLRLAYGVYTLVIHCYGQTQNATVAITSATPETVLFFCASAPYAPNAQTAYPTFTVATIAGVGGASLAFFLVVPWFRERRRKAEEEQRRVTL